MRTTSGMTRCVVVVFVTALPSAVAMRAAEKVPAKSGQTVSAVCPVMGETIPDIAKAAGKSLYAGKTYYFCSPECKLKFDANPANYSKVESNSKDQPILTDMLVYFAFDSKRERVGVIRPDGTGESYPYFTLPEQSGLRMGQVSPDGRYAELMNLSAKKYWRYDFIAKTITEAKQRQGEALPGGTRFLYPDNSNNVFTLYTADADGGNRVAIYSGPGYAYGFSLSPDGCKYAYHITGVPDRPGYEIYVIDIESKKSLLIVGDHKYIHFGPAWSPDGQWLLYQRCAHQQDPGHDRSDLCLSRADGSEHRVLTTGQSHWFAAAIGTPERATAARISRHGRLMASGLPARCFCLTHRLHGRGKPIGLTPTTSTGTTILSSHVEARRYA